MVWHLTVEQDEGLVICNGDECSMVNDNAGFRNWRQANPWASFKVSIPQVHDVEVGFKDLAGGSQPSTGHHWPIEVTMKKGTHVITHVIGYDGEGQVSLSLKDNEVVLNGQRFALGGTSTGPDGDLVESAGGAPVHVTTKDQYEKYITGSALVVVDFYADWCGPSRYIAPEFAQLAKEYPSVSFLKVDVDKNETGDEVSCMPTFKFYKAGTLLHTVEGASADMLRQGIKNFQ